MRPFVRTNVSNKLNSTLILLLDFDRLTMRLTFKDNYAIMRCEWEGNITKIMFQFFFFVVLVESILYL